MTGRSINADAEARPLLPLAATAARNDVCRCCVARPQFAKFSCNGSPASLARFHFANLLLHTASEQAVHFHSGTSFAGRRAVLPIFRFRCNSNQPILFQNTQRETDLAAIRETRSAPSQIRPTEVVLSTSRHSCEIKCCSLLSRPVVRFQKLN